VAITFLEDQEGWILETKINVGGYLMNFCWGEKVALQGRIF